jgi:hypothetical protein
MNLRAMATTLLGAVALAVGAAACAGADDAPAAREASASDRTALTSTVSGEAKRLTDQALAIVRQHPQANPNVARELLRPTLAQFEELSLTAAERQELSAYVQGTAQDVLKIVQRWGAADADFQYMSVPTPPPPGGCIAQCVLFFLLDCATGDLIGACFGAWSCEDGAVVDCDSAGEDPPPPPNTGECREDDDCPPGYGCATWAFKDNECVKKCDDNSDCPAGQKCKKPFGTSFKRCK